MNAPRSSRPVSKLLADSVALYKACQAQAAAILALGLLPGAILAAAAFWGTGLTTQDAVVDAINNGRWWQAAPLFGVGIVKRLLSTLVFMALIFALDARHSGRPLTLRQSFGFAVERFVPFVLTAARVLLYIFGGLLLFIVPGLILAVRYSLAHLAVLLEDLRGAPALARSRQLVSAELGYVLGRLALATVIAVILNVFVAIATSVFIGGAAALSGGTVNAVEGQLEAFAAEWLSGLVGAWLAGYSVLLYRELAGRTPPETAVP